MRNYFGVSGEPVDDVAEAVVSEKDGKFKILENLLWPRRGRLFDPREDNLEKRVSRGGVEKFRWAAVTEESFKQYLLFLRNREGYRLDISERERSMR